MNADGVCFGDQTSNCGTGSAELLLFVIGIPAGVVLLTLAFYAGAYPWRYMWLMLLPLRLRRSFEARFHLDEYGRDSESEWNLMCRVARKLTEQYGRDVGVVVLPTRRRRLSGIAEGLAVDSLRKEIWEPVRERPWLSRRRDRDDPDALPLKIRSGNPDFVIDGTAVVESYGDYFTAYAAHPEAKAAGPDGQQCRPDTRGLLQPLVITAEDALSRIGKESNRLHDDTDVADTDDQPLVYEMTQLPRVRC